jgi:hypothetical protein
MKILIIGIIVLIVGFFGFKLIQGPISVDKLDKETEVNNVSQSNIADFIVKGVSGEDILLNKMWDRGCIPGSNGIDWTHAKRTLTGLELVYTLVDYQNDSKTQNCSDGRAGLITITNTLTNDNVLIPITWVDSSGIASNPPQGLESVTLANGASGLMTQATVTAETQRRADELNQVEFCGYTDWQIGVPKDVVDCFTGGVNPGKGSFVVDDRSLPWKIYDGIGNMFDQNGYPTDMPNNFPHSGPF